MRPIICHITLATAILTATGTALPADAAPTHQTQRGSTQPKKGKKTAAKPKKRSGRRSGTKAARNDKPATSAEMKRREESTQKEIRLTRQQIQENEKAVKTGLAQIERLDADIAVSRQKVNDMSRQVNTLDSRINSLNSQIDANRRQLDLMRDKYLKALKKMRLTRGKTSALAFIFASDNFNQALRRMRYLKEFSRWRDRQTDAINAKVDELDRQTRLLAGTKAEKNRVLRSQMTAQSNLESQRSRQDVLVADLRRNGQALKSHLAKKQAEANDLRNQIAALIAAEQRRAEEQRRVEERKRAEEERRLAEERRKAEEERRLEAEREQALAEAAESVKASKEKKKESAQVKEKRKSTKKKEQAKTKQEKQSKKQTSKGGDYAQARKRKPRGDMASASAGSSKAGDKAKAATGGSFEQHRGSLPRPVSGQFRITSRFGRHPLPELPDVVYDNPGIDAEVSPGASAQAVFAGRVSGVYMLPGYATVIIVNHGNYYTVYGNIASPGVKVGDNVKQGQSLGRVASDPDDSSHASIHFEVWKNRDKLNPSDWIR